MTMGQDLKKVYEWRKKNIQRYNFDVNKETEKDVFEHLDKQENKRQYIIALIRKDIRRCKRSSKGLSSY